MCRYISCTGTTNGQVWTTNGELLVHLLGLPHWPFQLFFCRCVEFHACDGFLQCPLDGLLIYPWAQFHNVQCPKMFDMNETMTCFTLCSLHCSVQGSTAFLPCTFYLIDFHLSFSFSVGHCRNKTRFKPAHHQHLGSMPLGTPFCFVLFCWTSQGLINTLPLFLKHRLIQAFLFAITS